MDGVIIIVVVDLLLLRADRAELAKTFAEDDEDDRTERIIDVAFIAFTFFLCSCVFACVYVCCDTKHKEGMKKIISLVSSFWSFFSRTRGLARSSPKKKERDTHTGKTIMSSPSSSSSCCCCRGCFSNASFRTTTTTRGRRRRTLVNDTALRLDRTTTTTTTFQREKKKTWRRKSATVFPGVVSTQEEEKEEEKQLKRRRELLVQTFGAAFVAISGAALAADDVVLIDAPEGYAYESSQITTTTTTSNSKRKVWSDEESILKEKLGMNYSIEFPERFAALTDVSSARVVGVDCSFKDPRDEASTLAIFINTLPSDQRTLKDAYVSLDTKAKQMALSAKNQRTIRKEKYTKSGIGETWEIETEVGGGTAGRFGAAVELISLFVINEKLEVTVRATASLSSWKKVRKELRECVRSFELI